MVTMYDPFQIGDLTVRNRLVRSAFFEMGAEEGRLTPRILNLYRAVAEGGCGLIISGMEAVSHEGSAGPTMIETTYDDYERDMGKLAAVIHRGGGAFFVQLNHAGERTAKLGGYDRLAVMAGRYGGADYHEATAEELARVAEDFARSATRCRAAGCDGVQIHAAHGFLINTFLSPHSNKRTDAYGGPIEGRAKLLLQVYDAVRAAVGDDFPVSVKVPFSDRTTPSITPEECLWVCRELERRGIGMIEVSGGMALGGGPSSFSPVVREGQEGTFRDGAAQVAGAVRVPVLSVCGYRTPDFIEATLNETPITAISLGRPLLREPHLPTRWKTDRSAAACISCNRCYGSQGIAFCQEKARPPKVF